MMQSIDQKSHSEELLDCIPQMAWYKDTSGTYITVNRSFAAYCQKEKEEIIGKTDSEVQPHKLAMKSIHDDREILTTKTEKCVEEELPGVNGSVWYKICKVPVFDHTGNVIGITGTAEDITAAKTSQKESEEHKRLLKSIIDATPDLIFYKDTESRYLACNNSFARNFVGTDQNQLIGKTDGDFIHDPDIANFFKESDMAVLTSGTARSMEESILLPNGQIMEVETSKTPFYNEKGEITGLVGISRDITQRKKITGRLIKIEEELRKKDELISAVALSIKEFIGSKDYLKAMARCFTLIGGCLEVSRAYLYTNHYDEEGKGSTRLAVEWHSSSGESRIMGTNSASVSFNSIESFLMPLLRNESYCSVVRELNDLQAMHYLQSQGIMSILAIPIYAEDRFWGFIGFDDRTTEKRWTESEYAMVSTFAYAIEKTIERCMIEKELETARINAEAANTLKSQFLANISHEIRTPMHAILGYASLMNEIVENEQTTAYLSAIKKAGNNLLNLINDILDLSKIEAGKLEIQTEPVEIRHMFEDLLDTFSYTSREKNIDLKVEVDQDIPKILILDEIKLRQILFNLVGNAVKFTDEGYVSVTLKKKSTKKEGRLDLIFEVTDTGIGIAEEQQSSIFEPFKQKDGQSNKKYGGTGLGLSISKRMAEMMGGTIQVKSKPNEGATFSVELPGVAVGPTGVLPELSGAKTEEKSSSKPSHSGSSHKKKAKSTPCELMEKLENLKEGLWSTCLESNRVADIHELAQAIMALGLLYSDSAILRFAQSLEDYANTYNLKKIRSLLLEFPDMIEIYRKKC
jgi:PAS domain S-box-containing protein